MGSKSLAMKQGWRSIYTHTHSTYNGLLWLFPHWWFFEETTCFLQIFFEDSSKSSSKAPIFFEDTGDSLKMKKWHQRILWRKAQSLKNPQRQTFSSKNCFFFKDDCQIFKDWHWHHSGICGITKSQLNNHCVFVLSTVCTINVFFGVNPFVIRWIPYLWRILEECPFSLKTDKFKTIYWVSQASCIFGQGVCREVQIGCCRTTHATVATTGTTACTTVGASHWACCVEAAGATGRSDNHDGVAICCLLMIELSRNLILITSLLLLVAAGGREASRSLTLECLLSKKSPRPSRSGKAASMAGTLSFDRGVRGKMPLTEGEEDGISLK